MELPREMQGKFIEQLSLCCENFEYCSPEEWTDFLKVLGRNSGSKEQYDGDVNFARFVVERTNYLRKQIPAIISQFSADEPGTTPAQNKPAAELYEYDVEYVNKIFTLCEESVFQYIAHNEFCQCVATADFAPIFDRIAANNRKSRLLYVIHKLHPKVKDKEWYAKSAQSIGYKTKDCTKYKDDISERWIAEIDKIK